MADLRIDNPETTEQFVEMLAALDVKLPLDLHDEDLGVVIDADKRDVFTVDVNSEHDDEQVQQIAIWIVLAVNTCGGFKLERADHG